MYKLCNIRRHEKENGAVDIEHYDEVLKKWIPIYVDFENDDIAHEFTMDLINKEVIK